MANLYIHYPFCKQACYYCNFHFSTATKSRDSVWMAIQKEFDLRKGEMLHPLESIYFGGGSPSLLDPKQLFAFIKKIKKECTVVDAVEITIEVNPDDVSAEYLQALKNAGINRLSFGIQSFHQPELSLMNRAHDSNQALEAIALIREEFSNFSIDLIYGMPYSTTQSWEENINKILAFDPPHISAYALTVEPKTVLQSYVKSKKIKLLDEELVKAQYDLLIQIMNQKEYINYEFSNFGKPGFFSVNNQNYWTGKPYLGIGPSAHSYDGIRKRSWNIYNNHLYMDSISKGVLPQETEFLKTKDCFNEYIMTGLRTWTGVSLEHIKNIFGEQYASYLESQVNQHLEQNNLFWDGDNLKITQKAKFLTDGIAADLFML